MGKSTMSRIAQGLLASVEDLPLAHQLITRFAKTGLDELHSIASPVSPELAAVARKANVAVAVAVATSLDCSTEPGRAAAVELTKDRRKAVLEALANHTDLPVAVALEVAGALYQQNDPNAAAVMLAQQDILCEEFLELATTFDVDVQTSFGIRVPLADSDKVTAVLRSSLDDTVRLALLIRQAAPAASPSLCEVQANPDEFSVTPKMLTAAVFEMDTHLASVESIKLQERYIEQGNAPSQWTWSTYNTHIDAARVQRRPAFKALYKEPSPLERDNPAMRTAIFEDPHADTYEVTQALTLQSLRWDDSTLTEVGYDRLSYAQLLVDAIERLADSPTTSKHRLGDAAWGNVVAIGQTPQPASCHQSAHPKTANAEATAGALVLTEALLGRFPIHQEAFEYLAYLPELPQHIADAMVGQPLSRECLISVLGTMVPWPNNPQVRARFIENTPGLMPAALGAGVFDYKGAWAPSKWFITHMWGCLTHATGRSGMEIFEIFAGLSETWQGTLMELVEVVAFTASPPDAPEH